MARNIATPRKTWPTNIATENIIYKHYAHKTQDEDKKNKKQNKNKQKQKQKQNTTYKTKTMSNTDQSKPGATPGACERQAVPASHKTPVMPLIQSRLNRSVKHFQYYKY